MSENETFNRDFKGIWIPKEIWLDQSLSLFEKALFAEIDSLDGVKGCYADNKYFQKFFNVSERTLQEALKRLRELGYISVENFDGRTRILKSHLQTVYEKFRTSPPQNKMTTKNFAPLPREIFRPLHI
ncbi:helix-turn-helix domain-containing protein [bacterium]|nr:helix-turn-helix domain-containing protein [bacterium]